MESEQLSQELRLIYGREDIFAALEFSLDQGEILSAAQALHLAMRHQYWKEADLDGALAFGRTGIQLGLQGARACEQNDPELAFALRGQAKRFAYDVASFAWVGWDQDGITISPGAHAAGWEAARVNLRLAIHLERGDLPLSRAHWMIGAYQLADGDLDGAGRSFQVALDLAEKVDSREDAQLNRGYILLVKKGQAQGNPAASADFSEFLDQSRQEESGTYLVEQLEIAARVFARRLAD
jgi:hypothetical protein